MATHFTIYVVEDDPAINEILQANLQREGYQIRIFTDGQEALDAILELPPDLILLDLNLPGLSGIELARYVRSNEHTETIPIIMLTARSEEIDKIIGFEVGADDYVTKPFSPRELLARIRATLRRVYKQQMHEFQQGRLRINFATYEVWLDNQPVNLTPIQFKLLKYLVKAEGRVVSRQHLLDAIWGEGYFGDPRTVDVHITRLRHKIDPEGRYILTVKGVGYRWNVHAGE